jgi:translation initiation factor 3 subunit E
MADAQPPSASDMLNGAAQQAKSPQEVAKEYNLLPKLIPQLDRHLVFPLLNFQEEETPEDEDTTEIIQLKYALLKETNMSDFIGDLYAQLHDLPERPEEFAKKREEVLERRRLFEEETEKIQNLLADAEVVGNLRSDKASNMNYLKENHGVTPQMVDELYSFGQFQYNCGDYNSASELLYQFRILSTDNDKVNAATWGKLACDILTTNWESAMEEVTKIKESIETRLFNNPLAQLQHRTWLVHWSLFPFFNYEPARETLTDLFFSPAFINTIQTSSPWILRYLAAAVITNRSRPGGKSNYLYGNYQKQLKDLVRIVRQEQYEYDDPVTGFVKALYVDFDFEEAQKRLSEADEILRSDFFLVAAADSFLDAARHLISESYCKIHQRIDIKSVTLLVPFKDFTNIYSCRDLSTRLGLSQQEGEKWIVNLIRDTRVDAKIDYKAGTVLMNHPPQSVYQQVIERTKGGFFRTQVLSAAVAK